MSTQRTTFVLALVYALAAPSIMAQTCNPSIRPSAPDARFVVDRVKGTVLDTRTGLMWRRCVEGKTGDFCEAGSPLKRLSWSEALNRAASSTFAGFKDWRLPNTKELESLVEVSCFDPAFNINVFPYYSSDDVGDAGDAANSYIWTSSPTYFNNGFNTSSGDVLAVKSNSGRIVYIQREIPRYGNIMVRLVRGGQ